MLRGINRYTHGQFIAHMKWDVEKKRFLKHLHGRVSIIVVLFFRSLQSQISEVMTSSQRYAEIDYDVVESLLRAYNIFVGCGVIIPVTSSVSSSLYDVVYSVHFYPSARGVL